MFKELCDGEHTVVTNYLNNFNDGAYGINKINMIFKIIKNSIYYDPYCPTQEASETLMEGRGNNLDKNILLYTILKESGFKAKLMYAHVEDNTRHLIARECKIIPWFYVKVDFFGKIITLDCSFEREYMRAAHIHEFQKNHEEYIGKYYVDNKRLFNIIKTFEVDMEENINSFEKKCI
ncbi:hypothetical protein [Clostridium sp. JNZ J1-5]